MSALLYLLFCMKKNILFILYVTSYLYYCRCPFFIKYIVLCTVSCFIILYSTVQYISVKPLLSWENIFITTFNIEGKCHLILFLSCKPRVSWYRVELVLCSKFRGREQSVLPRNRDRLYRTPFTCTTGFTIIRYYLSSPGVESSLSYLGAGCMYHTR